MSSLSFSSVGMSTVCLNVFFMLLCLYDNTYICFVYLLYSVAALSNISPPRENLCIGATVSTKMGAKQGCGTGQTQPPRIEKN